MTEHRPPLIARYPFAIRLLAAACRTDLGLERVSDAFLDEWELASVRVSADGAVHEVLVDNEQGDADAGSRHLLLALVLMSLRAYEEDGDYEHWCREQSLLHGDERFRKYYERLGPASHAFRQRFAGLEAPTDYEWSLNSDAAQALRRLAQDVSGQPTP